MHSVEFRDDRQGNKLLGVIGGVSEEPWIDTAFNSIDALYHYAVLECVGKCII